MNEAIIHMIISILMCIGMILNMCKDGDTNTMIYIAVMFLYNYHECVRKMGEHE